MSNELYIYTTPPDADVSFALDSGVTIQGQGPVTANGRSDAHLCQLPPGTAGQGSRLTVSADGYRTFGPHRGLAVPSETGEAKFQLDDVHLESMDQPTPPGPEPPKPAATDPWGIIQEVYATGQFNLATHDGCGEFTEECCKQCHERNNQMWGHIKKTQGQNQYDGHAVDAMQCLAGEFYGIWDIIFDSVSPNAAPAFNNKGPADPALWYYPIDDETEIRAVPKDLPKADHRGPVPPKKKK